MVGDLAEELERATTISDIFEVVKEATWKIIGTGRAGLTCGLVHMGHDKNQMVGALYPVGSNIIVVNKTPLIGMIREDKSLFKPYIFHVLLHEYMHSLGYLDENQVRRIALQISEDALGKDHIATKMAQDLSVFIPQITYGHTDMDEETQIPGLEMVKDFDRSSINYIS